MSIATEVKRSKDILQKGGVILYPTDTVWGLGCNATDEKAVQKIVSLKKREPSKGMLILLSSLRQVAKYADIPDAAYAVAKNYKNPLTIIYPNARLLAPSLTAEDGSIAIRIVKDEFCSALINSIKAPLVSTSRQHKRHTLAA